MGANRPIMWSSDHDEWVNKIAHAIEQAGDLPGEVRLANGKINVSTIIVVATKRLLKDLSSEKAPPAKRFEALIKSYLALRALEQAKKVYVSEDTDAIISQVLEKLQTYPIKLPHATHGGKVNRRLIITIALQYVAELPVVKKAQ